MGDDSKHPVESTELKVDLPTPESPMRATLMKGTLPISTLFIMLRLSKSPARRNDCRTRLNAGRIFKLFSSGYQ